MFKIIVGFLPWIFYFILVGPTRGQHQLAITAALGLTLLLDFNTLKKGFILTWGTLIFFSGLLFSTFFVASNWPEQHANLIGNSALTLIAWFSLVINRPFTLQYAREQVPQEFWEMPGFLFVNQMITFIWALSFLIMTIMSVYQSMFNPWIYQMISYGPSVFAIWFTQRFPDWYKGYRFRILTRHKENPADNYYLQGNYAPIKTEINVPMLEVDGTLPMDIEGVYIRNGSNPMFDPITYTYPIDGDGMLHAVSINNGSASYCNRWVETKGLMAEKRAGMALYGGFRKPIPPDPKLIGKDGDEGPVKDGAFIHVICHAERLFAMNESNLAYEVTTDLKTVGPWCPVGTTLPFHVNAHTRLDAKTNELFAFTYDFHAPYLKYFVLNSDGVVTDTVAIDKPRASMIHDFVLTEHYVVFFDCPAIFDFNGLKKEASILRWEPGLGVNIIVVNRKTKETFSIKTENFHVYHLANGFEKDDQIIVDYIRYEKLFLSTDESPIFSFLYRATINLKNKTVNHTQCSELSVEFPRINDAFQTQPNRYIYMPTTASPRKEGEYNALLKFDCEKQSTTVHNFGKNAEIGEAVFIPQSDAKDEDDGYLGLYVYDNQSEKSEFVLLHAQTLADKPLARIHLPQRVPHGLHGNWIPLDHKKPIKS